MQVHSLRVLVVDDNVDLAESTAMLLEMDGHTTEVLGNGLAVLETARRFLPDLVLMDLELPGLDGCSVARQLRAEPMLDHALLVALTGWGRDADKRDALDAGFDVHLTKPSSLDALRKLLARYEPPVLNGAR